MVPAKAGGVISMLPIFAVVGTLALGCAAPVQYGGPIPVDNGGLGGRLVVLCRAGVTRQTRGACLDEVTSDGGDTDGDSGDADGDDSAVSVSPHIP